MSQVLEAMGNGWVPIPRCDLEGVSADISEIVWMPVLEWSDLTELSTEQLDLVLALASEERLQGNRRPVRELINQAKRASGSAEEDKDSG